MLATQRDTKAELNRRSQACEVLTDTGISRRVKMVEHLGIAPSIPAWKTGVYLSTPMLGKWSPVRELHPPKRFCRPLPIAGQHDNVLHRDAIGLKARTPSGDHQRAESNRDRIPMRRSAAGRPAGLLD